jgi:hypothetical protein
MAINSPLCLPIRANCRSRARTKSASFRRKQTFINSQVLAKIDHRKAEGGFRTPNASRIQNDLLDTRSVWSAKAPFRFSAQRMLIRTCALIKIGWGR